MIGSLARRAYGNAVIARHLRGQTAIPYQDDASLRRLRDARVSAMVAHAAASVPYYRDLFRREGIDPREIRSAEDLDRLPIVEKAQVARDPEAFRSTSRWGRYAEPFQTSGSTGTRLTIYHDYESLLANIAYGERERELVAHFCGRRLGYREAYVIYAGSTTEHVLEFYRRWTAVPIRPRRLVCSVLQPVEEIVAAMNRFHPDVLIGYGSYLEAFYRTLLARGLRLAAPRVIVYAADGMTSEGRALIERDFGIPVLSHYNAVEAFKIGFTCEARRGFHLHLDLCHLQIVDAAGRRLPAGETGAIVISNLVNRATVLLNYRLGDLGSMSDARCPCGRALPLLADLEGRLEDIVVLSNGRFVHPRAIWAVFKDRAEVIQYKLVQHARDRFELKLVTADAAAYAAAIERILRDLRALLGPDARIEAARHARLVQHSPAKLRPVLSLLHGQGQP